MLRGSTDALDDRLFVAQKWSRPDLSELNDLSLARLWIYGTKIESVRVNDTRLRTIDCEACGKLKRIESTNYDLLVVSGSRQFETDSIRGSVRHVELFDFKSMDLGFVEQCPQLETIRFTASTVEGWQALSACKHLKAVDCEKVDAEELSRELPNVLVNWYRNGIELGGEEVEQEWLKWHPEAFAHHRSTPDEPELSEL